MIWSQISTLIAEGERFMIATVTDTGGSTPRRVGAQMVITATAIHGTIGGGAIEHRVIHEARALLSRPPEVPVIHWLHAHLTHDLGMCCGGKMTVMLHDHPPEPRLWIFGAGHVGEALAEVARLAGFKVSVVDDRPEWASRARFHLDVDVVLDDPELMLRASPLPEDHYAVITTHDHALDQRLIERLARSPLRYLGLIGSAGKWGRFQKRLRDRPELTELERVRCPMGLAIGAQTPGEIAVSVVAELIQARRGAQDLASSH